MSILTQERLIGKPIISKKQRCFAVLDLFCGAGGFSEGFKQAGFKIVAGIDNDSLALETYSKNFPEAITLKRDLSKAFDWQTDSFRSILEQDIDVIIGGPPCQGFSIAGKRTREDPRNTLYRAYIKLIEHLNPAAIVVENVPTILSLFSGDIAKRIRRDFEALGYKTEVFTLTASDYGVPQSRRRTFFVGTKSLEKFKMPSPITAFSPITTEMAISDLPLLENNAGADVLKYITQPVNEYQRIMRNKSVEIYNHWAVMHLKRTIDIIKLVPDGGNYKNLPPKLRNTRKVNIAWTRMNSKKPCFTIDAGHNHHFHYKANRVPTVRECARIQSFPDRFRFFGNKTSQFRQVGNAVPPLLAKAIALSLKEVLR